MAYFQLQLAESELQQLQRNTGPRQGNGSGSWKRAL